MLREGTPAPDVRGSAHARHREADGQDRARRGRQAFPRTPNHMDWESRPRWPPRTGEERGLQEGVTGRTASPKTCVPQNSCQPQNAATLETRSLQVDSAKTRSAWTYTLILDDHHACERKARGEAGHERTGVGTGVT